MQHNKEIRQNLKFASVVGTLIANDYYLGKMAGLPTNRKDS